MYWSIQNDSKSYPYGLDRKTIKIKSLQNRWNPLKYSNKFLIATKNSFWWAIGWGTSTLNQSCAYKPQITTSIWIEPQIPPHDTFSDPRQRFPSNHEGMGYHVYPECEWMELSTTRVIREGKDRNACIVMIII